MTFSFAGNRLSRQSALAALAKAPLPEPTRAFVQASIDAVPDGHRNDLTPHFTIAVNGHLHDGKDHEHSSCSISVQPGWDARREDDGA